jgi:hypothetical protein
MTIATTGLGRTFSVGEPRSKTLLTISLSKSRSADDHAGLESLGDRLGPWGDRRVDLSAGDWNGMHPMTERTDLADQIATLEAERAGLIIMEGRLHERWNATVPGSDGERAIEKSLDSLCARLDAISDDLGALRAQLYLIDARESRREHLADAAYGRMR